MVVAIERLVIPWHARALRGTIGRRPGDLAAVVDLEEGVAMRERHEECWLTR